MKPFSERDFQDLGLSATILGALAGEGYERPTPIQAQAIPPVLEGRDLLGIAQTGTGKTAAFALPILNRLAASGKRPQSRGCNALILSPTRELASQIAENFRIYGRGLNLSVGVIFGGVGHRPQVSMLARGLDILVATPGRLLDHLADRHADLSGTEILVLDEADQMLDLGFVKPIRSIVSRLPRKRQTLFFSATMPKEIAELANEFLNNPERVCVTPVATTAERIRQSVINLEFRQKPQVLAALLATPEMTRTLVFTRTKRGADRVAKYLARTGIEAAVIHGNKSQRQREVALAAFKDAKAAVMIATDIAARGIDIDDVTHVINYDLPEVPEAYVHRIGRTARAGATGLAISLCCADERPLLKAIERLTRQAVPVEAMPDTTAVQALASAGQPNDGAHEVGDEPRQERSSNARGSRGQRSDARRGDSNSDRRQGRGQGRGEGRGEGRGQSRGPAQSQERRPERTETAARDGNGSAQQNGDARRSSWSPTEQRPATASAERQDRRDHRTNGRNGEQRPANGADSSGSSRQGRPERDQRNGDRRPGSTSGQRQPERKARNGASAGAAGRDRGDKGLELAGMPFLAASSTLRRPAKR